MTRILPEFRTERLRLTPRALDDLDAIMRLNDDPIVMRYLTAPGAASMSREAVAARSFAHTARGLGYWTVRDKDAGFLGYVGLIPPQPGRTEPQVSYRFAPSAWGNGYAGEALRPLLVYGFDTLDAPAIWLFTHPGNLASLKLAARLGFQKLPEASKELIGDPSVTGVDFRLSRARFASPPQAANGLKTR